MHVYIYIQLYTYSYGYVSSCQFFFWYLKFSSCKTMFWHWPLRRCQQLYFASRCPCAWSISFSDCSVTFFVHESRINMTAEPSMEPSNLVNFYLQQNIVAKTNNIRAKNQEQFLLRLSWHRLDSLWCIPYQNSFLVIPSDFRAIVNSFLWFG